MRVLFAGGGTGGHIYPAITLAETMLRDEPETDVLFVGTAGGLEADIVPRAGYDFTTIPVRYLRRRLSLELFGTAWTALKGFHRAGRIVREFRPDVVVGTGGYVSGPVVAAAALRRVPTVILEQNAYPGLTNRLLGRFVKLVALGHEAAGTHFRRGAAVHVTGNPIRRDVITRHRNDGVMVFRLAPERKTLLVFGGSQGGRSINEAIIGAAPKLLRGGLQIVHQTGARGFSDIVAALERYKPVHRSPEHVVVRDHWHIVPYIHDMPAAYAAADLVMSRAGAITLAELTAKGLPAILVPYPFSSEGHQDANAQVLVEAGAAISFADDALDADVLSVAVIDLLADETRLERMSAAGRALGRPEAANDIVNLIREVAALSS